MHFILTTGCIGKFSNLRIDYEKERQVDIEASPSVFGLPTVFGGTDVKTRRRQIHFLENILAVLDRFLLKEEEIKVAQQWQANLMASRIIIAACLYIQSEIGSSKENSALYRLINQYLGVTPENYFDNKDVEICYHTAFQLFNQPTALSHMNAELRGLEKPEFLEEEWGCFTQFLSKENDKRNAPKSTYNKYPVTTAIQPIFEASFTYVGSTIGWVIAEGISGSSAAIAPRLQLTSWVGSALLVTGPGSAGVALLAPTIASKLLSSFCTISLANMSGKAMGLAGRGTGMLVGMPFDLAYNLIRSAGSLLINYTSSPPTLAPIDGIRIADGVIVVKGNPIQFNLLPKQVAHHPILKITEEGEILLDKSIDTDEKMSHVVTELKERFAQEFDEPYAKIEEQESPTLNATL